MLTRNQLLRRTLQDRRGTALGWVEDLALDLEAHRVQAVLFRTGTLGLAQSRVAWQAIESFAGPLVLGPAPLADLPDSGPSPLGSPVVDTEGRLLGLLSDYTFAPDTGAVATYCCAASGRPEPIHFDPAAIQAASPEGFVITWSERAPQPIDARQQIAAEIEQVFAHLARLEASLGTKKPLPVAAGC